MKRFIIIFSFYKTIEQHRVYSKSRRTNPIPLDTAGLPDKLGKNQVGGRCPLLYDLETDPGESYNVINTRPEVAAKLRAAMEAWETQAPKNPRGFLPG
jgi:hypothetical protein